MSNKELCINLINTFEDYQLDNIILLLQSAKSLADETQDETFCLKLLETYENDADISNKETMSITDFAKEMGFNL